MLGSDYPFPLGEHHPGKLIESIEDMDEELKVIIINSVAHAHSGLNNNDLSVSSHVKHISKQHYLY